MLFPPDDKYPNNFSAIPYIADQNHYEKYWMNIFVDGLYNPKENHLPQVLRLIQTVDAKVHKRI